MLELDSICKSYTTNAFTQVALDNVSLAFRDNEFVSILGPSGSGKTTLLNVIGGLDHFDDGDLLIDGISTREYRDRDWDAYRNNRIGFVFQSYNLIPHQTILANVELALTLSGVSPAERRERARQALAEVGLGEHVDKRPSQLSGGQMQRVAIARALINDPEILLADEPTGALDSRTSVQVMDLLREVAADRLVIMVTHNPELARQYSTRIVELADGHIRSDSDPFRPTAEDMRDAKPPRRTSMSFLTALSLSFNNLMTKKGRTLMTAFAGSIGIIGIAAILALANGVNAYIQEVEEETLSVYPLQIMSSGFDMTSMIVDAQTGQDSSSQGQDAAADAEAAGAGETDGDGAAADKDADGADSADADAGAVREARMVGRMFGSVGKNDLASLKTYLDEHDAELEAYVQDIEYSYNVVPQVFADVTDAKKGKVQQVNPDKTFAAFGIGNSSSAVVASSSVFSTNVFSELPADLSLIQEQFDVKAGRWPKAYDELVMVLSRSGRLVDFVSYAMGLRDHEELEEMVRKLTDQEDFEVPDDERTYTYEELMKPTFRVLPASSMYEYEKKYKVWTSKADDEKYLRKLLVKAPQLRIVGVLQAREDVDATTISQGVYYTPQLTAWLMEQAADSKIVKSQLKKPSVNVITGKSFDAEASERGSDFDMGSLFSIDEKKISEAFSMNTDAFDVESLDLSGLDLSGLDLSGLAGALDLSKLSASIDPSSFNMPPMDLSSLQLPPMDFSNVTVDLSGIDLKQLNYDIDLRNLLDITKSDMTAEMVDEVTQAVMPDYSAIDLSALMAEVQPKVDENRIRSFIDTHWDGLRVYLSDSQVELTDSAAIAQAVSEYFATRVNLSELEGIVVITEDDQAKIAQNLQNAIKNKTPDDVWNSLSPETQAQLGAESQRIVGQLAQQVSQQVGGQVSGQIAQQMSAQLGRALSSAIGTAMQSYLSQAMGTYISTMANSMQAQLSQALTQAMQGVMASLQRELANSMQRTMERVMTQMMANMADAMHIDKDKFAKAFSFNMTQQELSELMMSLMSTERTSYENNLAKLGYADPARPSQIDIYPVNFGSKAQIIAMLDGYNDQMRAAEDEDKVITYTDLVGALMSSVTDIVNMISYVLIAFVAISLVVSSIMIGVITYISVLERKKEIGILRSIGASKRDVSRVFNAETVIEGLVSGIMGVGITALATIPANAVVEANFDVVRVARLPVTAAVVLVGVSVFLSFIAGLLPSRKAAKADPVEALRSE